MRERDMDKKRGPGRAPDGQPLCKGSDWTAPAFVPSSLTEERPIGGCSYLTSSDDPEYDDDGLPIESHKAVEVGYFVRPDGTGRTVSKCEDPWGSGQVEVFETIHPVGSWICDYWSTWPDSFGSRWGTRIVQST
jgi:hypothetical protein